MTASFHKFGEYFPGTGAMQDVGAEGGKHFSINFPLKEGMDDENFLRVYKPIIDEIFLRFKPNAVLAQCGADSLSGDRLGCFNLSVKGHGEAVNYLKNKGVPLLVVGGGGYTLRNVARCWAYETSVLTETEIPNEIPENSEYLEYFCPEYKMHMSISNMENLNTQEELEKTTNYLLQTLKTIDGDTAQVDKSSYLNGGGHIPEHMNMDDHSKDQELKEERA
jgi:histone deacetylase 1/2